MYIFCYVLQEDGIRWDNATYVEDAQSFASVCNQAPLQSSTVLKTRSLVAALVGCMVHFHKETCRKNGCAGNDSSCRMEMPRMLVDSSRMNEDNCTFLLRRNHGNLVAFCSTWMKAVYGNHMFSIIPESGRFERTKAIYNRLIHKDPTCQVRQTETFGKKCLGKMC